jgi:hypothetical protein
MARLRVADGRDGLQQWRLAANILNKQLRTNDKEWSSNLGCETWSLTVRDERVLRRIFGPKKDGVTGEWRKLHNDELHNLYSSPSIIRIIKSRRMRWVGHVARIGEKRNVYMLLVGKS